MTYKEFLENKIDIAPLSGIDAAEEEINEALKPHQKTSVLWALRGGRRGIFARFGLGKFQFTPLREGRRAEAEREAPTLFDLVADDIG